MYLSRFFSKIWIFVSYLFNKQCRTLMKYQPVKYELYPLSPGKNIKSRQKRFIITIFINKKTCSWFIIVSRHRLTLVQRKTLVLDLDETLIHSHHDGLPRNPSIKPGTPHDFTVSANDEFRCRGEKNRCFSLNFHFIIMLSALSDQIAQFLFRRFLSSLIATP